MAKRRLINHLPVIHQTQTLQKFFNATVDQVFQPGETQSINAFVGRKPSYFDAKKDFYKSEITPERAFYQLEPAMTTKTSDGAYADLLFYTDVVNQLRFQGADVTDHSRLFSSELYSWCPPVNIDKLTSYRNYVWLPDGPPVLHLDIPVTHVVSDGVQTVYDLPRAVPDAEVKIRVHINGVLINPYNVIDGGDYSTGYQGYGEDVDGGAFGEDNLDGITIDGNIDEGYSVDMEAGTITFDKPVDAGAIIDIWLNGDFKSNIEGKKTYKHTLPAVAYIDQTVETTLGNVTHTYGPITIETPPYLIPGMMIRIKDNEGTQKWEVRMNGTGELFLAVPDAHRFVDLTPRYSTIERRAKNLNAWSRSNNWFHKETVFIGATGYNPVQAQRPIIEFNHSLKLFNHGDTALPDINMVWDDVTSSPMDALNKDVSRYNWYGINYPEQGGFITVRILVRNSKNNVMKNQIVTASIYVNAQQWGDNSKTDDTQSNWESPDAPNWEYTATLVEIKGTDTPEEAECVALAESLEALWFHNGEWIEQNSDYTIPPLFQLYDQVGKKLDAYEGSSFQGSKLFSYSVGTTEDTVLGMVKKNSFGSFEFTDHVNSEIISHAGGIFPDVKFYSKGTEKNPVLHTTWMEAGTTTQTQNEDGLYEIPLNLQANPLNQNVTTISVNEWNKHFKSIRAANNWHLDSEYFDLSVGRHIVQHRSPMLKTMLMSSNASLDFQKAALYSEREYLRFRGRFNQTLNAIAASSGIVDEQATLVQILTQLRSAKTSDFPFFNNGVVGDYYIPATGAYLGLSPLWEPKFIEENGALLLRGHDGSLMRCTATPDEQGVLNATRRDLVMLALETALFNSAKKVWDDKGRELPRRPVFDMNAVIAGKFRSKRYNNARDYSRDEMLNIARPMFERWSAQNNYKYRDNNIYDENNPFTWNYGSVLDVDGEPLPGYWRGIYKHYFDTDRPHTHAWEMLGYTIKPKWWLDSKYNWGPNREALVHLIVNGIVNPDTNEIDRTYARPEFERFCPVGDNGELLNPLQAGIVLDNNLQDYSAEWEFGDGAPVENTWWNSFTTSFTIAQMSYLMKPNRFVESTWVTADEILANDDQWISMKNGSRTPNTSEVVHNEMVNNKVVRVLGLQTWLSDYIRSQGADITATFGDKVRSLGANIAHKLGGFIDATSLKAFTENTGLIPQEDVNLALYRSPSIREEFYGGVIIEKTLNGWRVLGYNVVEPVFKILPVNPTGRRAKLSLGDDNSANVEWLADTYYQVNTLVHYKNTNYRANKTHTSGRAFEQQYWTAESTGNQGPYSSVTWYLQHDTEVERIHYGHEFISRQDVADFLSGYQAYLESRGWVFDQYDSDINRIRNFEYSMLEFMYWSQAEWAPGTFITLSPAALAAKFTTQQGTVQNVEQLVNGVYSLLDKQGSAVPSSTVTVNRMDDQITIGVTEGGIYGARVFVSEVEQAIIFNNKTIFNDVIYEPLFNLRQNRIRIIGLLSTEWTGKLDAPGFVITDNRLVPSFERQAEDIRNMYDIEATINLPLRDNARHQVGYQGRDYLENLMYNDVNQFEFYQGMIQQKGAPGVFSKLLRNEELTQTRNLTFLEEWAFRKGVFGGTELRTTFEMSVTKQDIKQEPQLVQSYRIGSLWDMVAWDEGNIWDTVTPELIDELTLSNPAAIEVWQIGGVNDPAWITPPKGDLFALEDKFTRVKGGLPSAGYVRLNETTWQAPTLTMLNEQILNGSKDVQENDRVWIYKDPSNTWAVYRAVKPQSILSFDPVQGGTKIYLNDITGMNIGDILYIEKNVWVDAEELVGAHKIVATGIDNDIEHWVQIAPDTLNGHDYAINNETAPVAMWLQNVRVKRNASYSSYIVKPFLTASDVAALGLDETMFQDGELVYVDAAYEVNQQMMLKDNFKRWAVFAKKGNRFVRARIQPARLRRDRIVDVKVFDNRSVRDSRTLNAKPMLYGDIVTYDPIAGLISGQADKELYYKVEHDPAYYNSGAAVARGMEWGAEQVGRLWWNLDTVRFLTAETNETLDDDELLYRAANWGKLAPLSSVDIWEWTKSYVTPADWQTAWEKDTDPMVYDGEILNPSNPSWVEGQEWDEKLSAYVNVYYFWVKNRKNVPANKDDREIPAFQVANIISNPTLAGIAWVAPITQNAFIFQGITPYLTATSTVQFTVAKGDNDVKQHVEWELLREGDDRSLPAEYLWDKMVNSLTARDVWGNKLPNTDRYVTDRVGFDVEHGQNVFKDVLAARKNTVQHINALFANVLVTDTRRDLSVLNGADGKTPFMHWTKNDTSYYVEPVPANSLWSNRYGSLTDMLQNATENSVSDLVYLVRGGEQYWSVMGAGRWDDDEDTHTMGWDEQAWDLDTILLYHFKADSLATLKHWRDVLQGKAVDATVPNVKVGQRVIVDNDVNTATGGLWTLWQLNANKDFTMVCSQKYNSKDAWSYSDWYETGVNIYDEPITVYATIAQRNLALGISDPKVTRVKVLDDGKGTWVWTEYRNGTWEVIAKQNGTIKLNDTVWANYGNYLEETNTQIGISLDKFNAAMFAQVAINRDLGYELNKVLNVLRDSIMTGSEQNELFFGWVKYAHTEQDFIDWAFKTSFMYVTGYNDKLRQDPIAFADLTSNLVDYINEVKPYHVKVRDFISKYGVDEAVANVKTMDYDKPAYYDPSIAKTRILNPDVIADLKIIQEGVWINWYNQMAYSDNNKVRKIDVSMKPAPSWKQRVKQLSRKQPDDRDVATVHINENVELGVIRKDYDPETGDHGWDIADWDQFTVWDYDYTVSTKDYLTEKMADFSVYDYDAWGEFGWDAPPTFPRITAVRVEGNQDTSDNELVDLYLNANHNVEPAFILRKKINSNEGKWAVRAIPSKGNSSL